MTPTIAIHLGDFQSFNVQMTVRNFVKMLTPEFKIDLISTAPESFPEFVHQHCTFYGSRFPNTKVGSFRALRAYVRGQTPTIVTQIGDVPIYGNSIGLLKPPGSTFVCRYSGDLFYEYTLETGFRKLKLFALKNILGRAPLHYADWVIAMGPREKTKMVSRGRDPETIETLPPPIDPSRLDKTQTPQSLPQLTKGPVALFVGRISRLKGAGTLEAAIPRIIERRPNFQFVLVGTPEYELRLPTRYAEQVYFTGAVPPVEVPGYLNRADVYIHPSLTEGVSRSVLEALACETPVVVRDVGDLASVTENLFTTLDDFVKMVCEYESLPLDPITSFTIEGLREPYCEFFSRVLK